MQTTPDPMTGQQDERVSVLQRSADRARHYARRPLARTPYLWDAAMKDEATQMILQGTQLEIEYARDTMPRGVLGMNAATMEEYLKVGP